MRSILFVTFALVLAVTASAQTLLKPGKYVLDKNSGDLLIKKDNKGNLRFEIHSWGGNCHSCTVSGDIRNNVGITPADDGERCKISFESEGDNLVVRPMTEDACRGYCGMRAGFDGKYRVPPKSCTVPGRQAQRDIALRSYRQKRYAEAADVLQKLMSDCGDFIDWMEIDKIRNDLALSQYHQGEYAQCLKTLDKSLVGESTSEEDVESGNYVSLPPCDYDNYIDIANAVWFNKAQCRKALAKQGSARR